MSKIYTDAQTSNIADLKLKKNKKDNKIKKNFTNMLLDFNVLQYIVGFGIAISFREFLFHLIESIIDKFGIKSKLMNSFLVCLSMIVILYFLVFHFFINIYILKMMHMRKHLNWLFQN